MVYYKIRMQAKEDRRQSSYFSVTSKRKFKDLELAKTYGERLKRELRIAGLKVNISYPCY